MIKWVKDTDKYANGDKGYVGVLKLFYIGYDVLTSDNKENPYLLTSTLPQTKTFRFKTEEEGKKKADKMFKNFIKYSSEKYEEYY